MKKDVLDMTFKGSLSQGELRTDRHWDPGNARKPVPLTRYSSRARDMLFSFNITMALHSTWLMVSNKWNE
jgi:hypothetical protein